MFLAPDPDDLLPSEDDLPHAHSVDDDLAQPPLDDYYLTAEDDSS